MTDDTIELNRRRVLGGIITIGGAAAAAGAGTFAAFSDTESSTGNTITAGTLNLELNPNNSGASTTIGFTDIAPGDSGYMVIELSNVGSINGNLTGANIGDTSGGSFQPSLVSESDGTPSDVDNSGSGAVLDDNLEVGAFIEASGDLDSSASVGTSQGGNVPRSSNAVNVVSGGTTLSSALGTHSPGESLNSSGTKYFVLNYTLPRPGTGNAVQGDSVEFDVQFVLEQA